MSEVKRYYVHWNDQRYVADPKNGNLVMVEDFDRVTAERDAALETVVLKHRDMVAAQTAVTGWARKFDALQALLTAADERADVLEGLLREAMPALDLAASAFKSAMPVRSKVRAALKPADDSKCDHLYIHFGTEQPRRRCNNCNRLEPVEGGGDVD